MPGIQPASDVPVREHSCNGKKSAPSSTPSSLEAELQLVPIRAARDEHQTCEDREQSDRSGEKGVVLQTKQKVQKAVHSRECREYGRGLTQTAEHRPRVGRDQDRRHTG